MDKDGVLLARRQSGGGAVFHDLGNTNFTFLSGKSTYDKTANNRIITNAVNSFGLKSFASGRNDLVISSSDGDRKFSGSAFKETKDRSFHHGTLLINTDLTKLSQYLNPDIKKLQSKGITSVKSRVVNLSDLSPLITHDLLQDKIIFEFFNEYQTDCSIEILDQGYLSNQPKLIEHYNKMNDWNWRFGETPQFNHEMSTRFDWGGMDVHMDVHHAKIEKIQIFSDSLHPEMVEKLMEGLTRIAYDKASIANALLEIKRELPMITDYLNDFESWIIKEIN